MPIALGPGARPRPFDLPPHVLHLERLDCFPIELQFLGDIADRGLPAATPDIANRLVKWGLSARNSSRSRFTEAQAPHSMRRTSNSRTIRNPALDRSRTRRSRQSYQPIWTRPQQLQIVFLSADRA